MFKLLLPLLFLLAPPFTLQAHQDPHGDIHPEVRVEDGNFVIVFNVGGPDENDVFTRQSRSMTYSKEGKLLIPRHVIATRQFEELAVKASHQNPTVEFAQQNNSRPRLVLIHKTGVQETRQPLPLQIDFKMDSASSYLMVDQATFAGPWIGLTWATEADSGLSGNFAKLNFSIVSREGFTPGETVTIGDAGAVYSFPSASAPVWAGGRWWIAWIRPDGEIKRRHQRWRTELSSYDPVTRKLEHKTLPGRSHWNSTLSMKTTGGWLGIAWHAAEEYPGTAQIITAFERLSAP